MGREGEVTDAVAQAREAVKQALRWCSECGDYTCVVHPEQGEAALDALIAAVRAEYDAALEIARKQEFQLWSARSVSESYIADARRWRAVRAAANVRRDEKGEIHHAVVLWELGVPGELPCASVQGLLHDNPTRTAWIYEAGTLDAATDKLIAAQAEAP